MPVAHQGDPPRRSSRGGRVGWRGFIAAVVAGGLFSATPLAGRLDAMVFDAAATLSRAWGPRPVVDRVVVIGIDEATERTIVAPLAMWHRPLGQLLTALAAARPKAIVLDLALPDRSFDAIQPGLDAALVEGITAAKRAAPLVVGLALDGSGRPRPVYPLLLAAIGEDALALAYATADADGTVRSFVPGPPAPGALPTLPERVVRLLGVPPKAGLIGFDCGAPMTYHAFIDVLHWLTDGDEARLLSAFEGRVVMVGSVLPDLDRVRQPLSLAGWEPHSTSPPGVVLQAHTVRALDSGCMIDVVPAAPNLALLAAMAAICFVRGLRRLWVLAALILLLFGVAVVVGYRNALFVPPAGPALAMLISVGARTALEAIEQRRARLEVQRRFAGYVSPDVLAGILGHTVDAERPSKRPGLAFLFADIRGFTTLSETMPAEHVVRLLNRYYEAMVPAIHAHGGTIDNFRGDGIMVVFGAPRASVDSGRDAAMAARAMFTALPRLNQQLMLEALPPLAVGIGIAVGEAVVGNVGAANRHDYTAIGDAVNVAARLQSLCKALGMRLIATQEVARAAVLPLEPLGELELAGHTPVPAWGWPIAPADGESATRELPNPL